MTLEKLHQEWDLDAELPTDQLDKAIRDVPRLHGKWWRIYSLEKQKFLLYKQEYADLRNARRDWYLGRMDDAERERRGWPLQHIRTVRQEAETALAGDTVLHPLSTKLELSELKLKFVEDVIRSINFRNASIRNYIDYLKFSQGAG